MTIYPEKNWSSASYVDLILLLKRGVMKYAIYATGRMILGIGKDILQIYRQEDQMVTSVLLKHGRILNNIWCLGLHLRQDIFNVTSLMK